MLCLASQAQTPKPKIAADLLLIVHKSVPTFSRQYDTEHKKEG